MRFLPIIERELRAASRRKSTYRVRWWATLIATLSTLLCFLLVSSRSLPIGVTNPLFAMLAGCAFILCLFAGVFLTADSLSEEKREGTLGLLFLSNLLGRDIVLGKFSALSLNAFFSVIALLPVMGVPLLLGGVDGMEFFRVVLALLNMLFFSLAAGMSVSAFGRTQSVVVGSAIGILVLLVCGLPLWAELAPSAPLPWARACLAWSSPFYPFAYAFEAIYVRQPPKYWGTLFASHFVGWFFLVLASLALPGRWQDTGKVADAPNPGSCSVNRSWNVETKRRENRGEFSFDYLLGCLMGEARLLRWIVWGLLGAWCLILAINWGRPSEATLVYGGTKMFAFLLKLFVAFQACKFFSESRSSGVLELLLCTPLQNYDIIRAQWRKLRRIFLWPSIVLILLAMISNAFVGTSTLPVPGAWQVWFGGSQFAPSFGKISWLAIALAADILAVGWCGMCLGLTLKKPILAPAFTIIFVLILPSAFSWLDLVVDLLFISWATTRLREDFRHVLIRRYQSGGSDAQFAPVPAPDLAPAL